MTAVPGSGADLAGAAAIPPTDGRWGALSGPVTPLWPAVTQVGTPATVVQTTANATGSVTGTWSGTQPRTFGDLLIACVTSYGDAGIGTTGITETSGTWARQGFAVTVGTAASIWVKVAGGGDAAPTFNALMTGTVATTQDDVFPDRADRSVPGWFVGWDYHVHGHRPLADYHLRIAGGVCDVVCDHLLEHAVGDRLADVDTGRVVDERLVHCRHIDGGSCFHRHLRGAAARGAD